MTNWCETCFHKAPCSFWRKVLGEPCESWACSFYAEEKSEWYLHDCLSLLKNIQDSGDCNVCASKKDCQYAPKWGQMVRYNCPFYKKEGAEK